MPDTPVRIETANPRDIEVCFQLLSQHYGDDPTGALHETLLQVLRDERSTVFLAYLEEVPVGVLVLLKRISLEYRGLVWVVGTLVVDGHYRRLGIGSALLNHCLEVARQGLPRAVVVHVSDRSRAAIEFVESLGFRHEGFREYVCHTSE